MAAVNVERTRGLGVEPDLDMVFDNDTERAAWASMIRLLLIALLYDPIKSAIKAGAPSRPVDLEHTAGECKLIDMLLLRCKHIYRQMISQGLSWLAAKAYHIKQMKSFNVKESFQQEFVRDHAQIRASADIKDIHDRLLAFMLQVQALLSDGPPGQLREWCNMSDEALLTIELFSANIEFVRDIYAYMDDLVRVRPAASPAAGRGPPQGASPLDPSTTFSSEADS